MNTKIKKGEISHTVQIEEGCLHFGHGLSKRALPEYAISAELKRIAKENTPIKHLILRGYCLTEKINQALAQLIAKNLITEVLDLAESKGAIQALKTLYSEECKAFFPRDLRLNNSHLVDSSEAHFLLDIINAGGIDKLDLRSALLTGEIFKKIYMAMSQAPKVPGSSQKTIRLDKAKIKSLCFEDWIYGDKDLLKKINSDLSKVKLIIQDSQIWGAKKQESLKLGSNMESQSWGAKKQESLKLERLMESLKLGSNMESLKLERLMESLKLGSNMESQIDSELTPRIVEGELYEIRDFLES